MKLNRSIIVSFVLLVVIAAIYRAMPDRPFGFAPQIAMAVFGGAVIRNRMLAFALPLLSMLVSDLLYHLLYLNGMSRIPGFYSGQLTNYILFALLTVIGFFIKRLTVVRIFAASLIAPTVYFLLSNFLVWINGGGFIRPKTFQGLMQCYQDALPFYRNSLAASVFFCAVLFGGYYLVKNFIWKEKAQAA
ncbi:MAG: DUF6580 family putative transport protein [Chitinophagaceae bacterium]|nr:DUF6580 family putative transport protein [Chitinophagaceae bacterium]